MFRVIILITILSFNISCNSTISSSQTRDNKDSINTPTQKNILHINSYEFTHREINTNSQFNTVINTSNIPTGFLELSDMKEIKFDVNFCKNYFNINDSLNTNILTSDSFYHIIIRKYLEDFEGIDFKTNLILDNTLNKSKFTFSTINIKNYGICNLGIVYSGTCNADQNKTLILINNQKKELSIWNYDEFKFDKQGNISALFRLKDRRTWYYYNYDTSSNCFIPIATKYWKLYDN